MAKPRNKGGRPSKYTPQVALAIVADIAHGMPRDKAAKSAGVGASTFYRWLQWGLAGDARFAPLSRAVAGATNGAACASVLPDRRDPSPRSRQRGPTMARPSQFDQRTGRLIIAHVAVGATRGEAADAAGVALRAIQYWLARGRRGEPPFEEFAARLDRAADRVRRAKVAASYERNAEISKGRWQVFKVSRERWWLDHLGPFEFWARRYAWCRANGRDHGKARALGEIARLVRSESDRRSQA
jgi:transposase